MKNMQTKEGPSTWGSNPKPSRYVTLLQVMSTILRLDLMMICCATSCSDVRTIKTAMFLQISLAKGRSFTLAALDQRH